jgi:hypothetical protein
MSTDVVHNTKSHTLHTTVPLSGLIATIYYRMSAAHLTICLQNRRYGSLFLFGLLSPMLATRLPAALIEHVP